jgi:SecD/SecF fusion protein
MKSFFWKFVICFLPCAIAAYVTADAVGKYARGESGGFKLGTDLVGGTILVYEIDLRKSAKESDKTKAADAKGGKKKDAEVDPGYDPRRDIAVLAEALKRRIDPNDLKNITIRPSGGEGRVEIVLPTGGTHRAQIAQEKWQKLLDYVKSEYGLAEKIEVGRGHILELAERVQLAKSKKIWREDLFNDPAAWQRLIAHAVFTQDANWPIFFNMDEDAKDKKEPAAKKKLAPFEALRADKTAVGDLPLLEKTLSVELAKVNEPTTDKAIQAWLKLQAWEETMLRARKKWPDLAPYKEEMDRISPDSIAQLTTFIQSKGSILAQSSLGMLRGLLGSDIYGTVPTEEIAEFIKSNYGPSVPAIAAAIQKEAQTGYGKDLTVEGVQQIKELVAKVGRLEFRILANSHDDKDAIEKATAMLNKEFQTNPQLAQEIKDDQAKGLPPPGPRDEDGNPKKYTINLARGNKSIVTYSWMELGQTERRDLNLDNAAKNDATRSRAWVEASLHRDQALKLLSGYAGGGSQQYLLQGALFFSRKCEDRNIPEEDRRKKEVEYFVLTRDPEYSTANPNLRTPDIDGSLLSNAYADRNNTGQPIVGFNFGIVGADLFGTLTRKNVAEGSGPEGSKTNRYLAIILDGLVMSAPTINSEIRERGSISGSFTQKQVDELVNILRAGRLPATLKPQPVSESTIGATLGEDTINKGVWAILIAFAFILAFMCVYYRFAGLVASVALLANLLLTVGFMVFVQATFTLPGLAGLVLMLGMAVDANILIYERLREERERGASLALAIRNGYDRALPTIIDTHLSSIFTAIVLYVVGNDQLKGFGVSVTVGLIISLFTSLFMTRVIFDYWLSRGWLHKLGMFRLFARPNFDFMGIRYLMFGLTAAASVLGIALFLGRMPLNIDFVGGTAYGGKLTKAVSIVELRDLLDEKNQGKVLGDVKVEEEAAGDGRRFLLTYNTGEKRTVSLVNPPPTDEPSSDRIEAVRKQAMALPDPTVELIFTQDQSAVPGIDGSHSNQFVVRTAEKEVELVQAGLDQLLRDEHGNALLKKTLLKAEKFDKRKATMRFYDEATGEPTPGSPGMVKTLLSREVRKALVLDNKYPLPCIIEVNGEGEGTADEAYKVVEVTFSELKDELVPKIETALKATETAYADRPQPDRLENFDSQLAMDTRYRAMAAILASWGAILVYLWFRFGSWTFGLAAVLCLIHDLFFTLGAIAACHYLHYVPFLGEWLLLDDFKVDLPAVAALLTLVGYSVNDTIVVFDRIKEVRGKNPDLTPKMLNDSINQTLSRTILASLATWLVVFVLYVFGGPGVHLFAFVMVVGVIVGTYSSIYIASPLLLLFGEGRHDDERIADRAPAPKVESAVP